MSRLRHRVSGEADDCAMLQQNYATGNLVSSPVAVDRMKFVAIDMSQSRFVYHLVQLTPINVSIENCKQDVQMSHRPVAVQTPRAPSRADKQGEVPSDHTN